MDLYSAIILVSVLVSLAVGIVSLARGGGRVGRFSFGVGAIGVALWLFAVGSVRVSHGVTTALGRAQAAGLAAALLPLPWTLLTLVFARADQRVIVRRWRFYLLALVAAGAIFAVRVYVGGVIFGIERTRSGYLVSLGPWGRYMLLYLITAIIVMLFNLETTARCATKAALSRVKYALLGMASVMVFYVFVLSMGLLYSVVNASLLAAGSVPVLAAAMLIGHAVVWRRLNDDRIPIGRPVFYTSATALVSGAYLLALAALGWAVRARGWSLSVFGAASAVFLALLLLAIFLLSTRARRGLRRFVDANFYLNRYDYRREWAAASRALSSAVDTSEVVERTRRLVGETLDTDRVVVLLLREGSGAFETSGLDAAGRRLARALEMPSFMEHFRSAEAAERVSPEDAGAALAEWVEENRGILDGGVCVVAPLRAAGELVGVIALGRGRGGRYTTEDLDLLSTLGSHAGNAVLATRLAERLAVSRETESFHRLSSFVVHDLKNCVTGLSLTLRNAEDKMCDPEFRRDLLEAVSDSTASMKHLIGRLSTVRSGLELDLGPVALEDVVERALATTGLSNGSSSVRVRVSVEGAPMVAADSDALVNVFENLFLNACEAVGASGEIFVGVRAGDRATVVVTIEDTGPGIPDDLLVSAALFGPFRSSKPDGLGVGLHQVKTIVEAHGGAISASNTGTGARFEMSLPVFAERG